MASLLSCPFARYNDWPPKATIQHSELLASVALQVLPVYTVKGEDMLATHCVLLILDLQRSYRTALWTSGRTR